MPYGRRYGGYRRRRGYRRGRSRMAGRSNLGSIASIAKTALSTAMFVKSLINVEHKNVDITLSNSAAIGTTWNIACMTFMAQGDTDATRNGNSILAKSLNIKILLNAAAASTAGAECRFIIVRDKVSAGALPAVADLFDGGNSTVARYNPDNAGSRFEFLADKTMAIGCTGTNTAGGGDPAISPTFKQTSLFRRLHGHCKFDGTTGAIGDTTTGHIFFCWIATSATNPVALITSRFTYIDN